jgi:hypothetical protein
MWNGVDYARFRSEGALARRCAMTLRNNDGLPFNLYRAGHIGLFESEQDARLAAQGKGEWGSNEDVHTLTYIHASNGNIYQIVGPLEQMIVPAGLTEKVNSARAKLTPEELDALQFSLSR